MNFLLICSSLDNYPHSSVASYSLVQDYKYEKQGREWPMWQTDEKKIEKSRALCQKHHQEKLYQKFHNAQVLEWQYNLTKTILHCGEGCSTRTARHVEIARVISTWTYWVLCQRIVIQPVLGLTFGLEKIECH